MADNDKSFDELINEQKKTTSSLNRVGKTLREQLLGDKSKEKDESRIEAGNKAWQTRQTNIAKTGKKVGETAAGDGVKQNSFLERMLAKLTFLKKGTEKDLQANKRQEKDSTLLGRMVCKLSAATSPAKDKEARKDQQSFMGKTMGGLGKTFKKGFTSLGKVFGKFKALAGVGLVALMTVLGFGLLIKFLESKHWKKIRDWVKGPGLIMLKDLWTGLKEFYVTYLKPIVDWLIAEGPGILKDLWTNFKLMLDSLKIWVTDTVQSIKDLFKVWTDPEADWKVKLGSIFVFFEELATNLYNFYARLFGWEETDSIGGSIKKWFRDLYIKFQDIIGGTIEQIGINIKEMWNDTITTIKDFFTGIPKLLKNFLAKSAIGRFFGMEAEEEDPEVVAAEERKGKIIERTGELIKESKEDPTKKILSMREALDQAEREMQVKEASAKEALALAEEGGQEAIVNKLKEKEDEILRVEKLMTRSAAHIEAKGEKYEETEGDIMLRQMREKQLTALKISMKELKGGEVDKAAQDFYVQEAKDRELALREESAPPVPSEPVEQVDYTPEMDKTTPVEASTLNNRIAELESKIAMARSMGTVDGEMLGPTAENIKRLEQKKAELEAAKSGSGGGSTTNIAQDNSNKTNQSQTTHTSKRIVDPEMSQVAAANP